MVRARKQTITIKERLGLDGDEYNQVLNDLVKTTGRSIPKQNELTENLVGLFEGNESLRDNYELVFQIYLKFRKADVEWAKINQLFKRISRDVSSFAQAVQPDQGVDQATANDYLDMLDEEPQHSHLL